MHPCTDEKKPAGDSNPTAGSTARAIVPDTTSTSKTTSSKTGDRLLVLVPTKTESRVDSRLLAKQLGGDHANVFELVTNYRADFEQLGVVRFQTEKPLLGSKGGRPERFALLNEDQAYLLLTYRRNTAKVRALKVKLVQAFSNARRAAEIRQTDYLPAHHLLQDAIKAADNGTPKGPHYYINANNALNKLAGLQSGQRASAGPGALSLLTVGACLAAEAALQKGDGVLSLHQRIKAALMSLQGVPALLAHADMLHLPSNTGGNT